MSVTGILTMIGTAVGAIFTGISEYFVSKLLRQEEKKERDIEWHFNILVSDVIEPIMSIVDKLGIQSGQIVREWKISVPGLQYLSFPKSFDFEGKELFESFEAHYPEKEETWQKLKGETTEHNEKAVGFQRDIEAALRSGTNLFVKKANTREEMIIDHTPGILCQTLCQLAQGQTPNYDFRKATHEPINSLRQIRVGATGFIITSTQKVKRCKSVLVGIQESPEFRRTALEIIHDAEQIKSKFKDLENELNDIKSYGLRSKNPMYEFKPVKNCPICKKLFYKSKQKHKKE